MSTRPGPPVLVADDEDNVFYTLRAILQESGVTDTVLRARNGAEALELLGDSDDIALVLTDFRMPEMDGMALLQEMSAQGLNQRVVMITAHGSERLAVEAMKAGALDYFRKPFDADDIVRVVRRALQTVTLESENSRLRAGFALSQHMVFASDAMWALAAKVDRVARRDVTVLIGGESGTGKELLASAIVAGSPRSGRPFVRFNCAALPEQLAEAELFGHTKGAFSGATQARRGLLREAHGGTLMLDEVGELSPSVQAALLRALEAREIRPLGADRPEPVDVRIIAASNRDLANDPAFREDLFYRLAVVRLQIPPLRERPEDIAPLARHFARLFGDRFGLGPLEISPATLAALRAREWRGNVRELRNLLEEAAALCEGQVIDSLDDIETPPRDSSSGLRAQVEAFERGVLERTLAETGGNRSEAARRLRVSRMTLVSKLKRYDVK